MSIIHSTYAYNMHVKEDIVSDLSTLVTFSERYCKDTLNSDHSEELRIHLAGLVNRFSDLLSSFDEDGILEMAYNIEEARAQVPTMAGRSLDFATHLTDPVIGGMTKFLQGAHS